VVPGQLDPRSVDTPSGKLFGGQITDVISEGVQTGLRR